MPVADSSLSGFTLAMRSAQQHNQVGKIDMYHLEHVSLDNTADLGAMNYS
jgi:hypothetical protein